MNKSNRSWIILVIWMTMLMACRSQPETQPTLPELVDVTYSNAFKTQKKIEQAALQASHTQQNSVQQSILTNTPDAARFNIAANEVPAGDFFLSLVQELETNIVVHPEVTGTLSINLKEVTLKDILKAAQDIYGLHIEQQNGVYFIFPAQVSTRIYQLNYINLKRTGSSSMSVSSGQISSSEDSGTSSSGTEITTETEVDFWDGIENTLSTILGTETGREVVVNPHSGIVVVKGNQAEHKSIEAFLNQVQANLQRQVIIEAKVLEVTLSDSFQSGIEWKSLGNPGSSGKTIEIKQTKRNLINQQNDLENIFTINLALSDFSSIIELLETQGEVKVLSSPRISTVNNQKAVIKVGTDEFFVTEVIQNTTTTATETTNSPEVTLTPFFSGIALDVTPQISSNQEVILHVHPTVSEVQDVDKTIDLGDDNILRLPLAFSSIRESDSIIRARNQEVVILGGLLKMDDSNIQAKVPWISNIPFIGQMFRQTEVITSKSELVILLKPNVVENFTWRTMLEDSQHFLNQPSTMKKPPSASTVFR